MTNFPRILHVARPFIVGALLLTAVLIPADPALAGPTRTHDVFSLPEGANLILGHGWIYEGPDAFQLRNTVDTDNDGRADISEWALYKSVILYVYDEPEYEVRIDNVTPDIQDRDASIGLDCYGAVSKPEPCLVTIMFEFDRSGNRSHLSLSGTGTSQSIWVNRNMTISIENEIRKDHALYFSSNLTVGDNETPELSWNEFNWELRTAILGNWTAMIARDSDADGTVDRDDSFPGNPDEWADDDEDGLGNNGDPCPHDHASNDTDDDGISDACDPDLTDGPAADSDGDGVPNRDDSCPGSDDLSDQDFDKIPDQCDNDRDGDGVLNVQDRFPNDSERAKGIPMIGSVTVLLVVGAMLARRQNRTR